MAIVAVAMNLATADAAHADNAASAASNELGKAYFADGRFDEAIAAWDRAFAESPAPEYSHNIAQAHRRKGDCRKAIEYFEKYLAAAPQAENRGKVAGSGQAPSRLRTAPRPAWRSRG
jgi:tetratricopeptide (TPR) repeat protein